MSMNIFRLAGDMCHVLSILVLLWQLHVAKNARGISVRTNELFLIVFITRYVDLFTTFYSIYNSVIRVLFIVGTAWTVYAIKLKPGPIKATYDASHDSFPHGKLAVAPCAVIATWTHLLDSGWADFNLLELLWTFSLYLESIAILPQLIMLRRYRKVENLTAYYVFFMGAYRGLYILKWVYRSQTEKYYRHHWLVYFCGALQTLLYADFFYYYLQSKIRGRKFTLPSDDGDDSDDDEEFCRVLDDPPPFAMEPLLPMSSDDGSG